MDVERIQKINNLALNLMKQGLAQDREAAVAQAEKIFKDSDSEGYTSMMETLKKDRTNKPSEAKRENSYSSNHQSEDNDDLSKERIKEILGQNTKYIVSKLREFQERVQQLEAEIANLKTKMTYQRLPTASQFVSQKNQQSSFQIEEPNEEPPAPQVNIQKTENTQNHPRSGNFKENDVSIEKFFYMGNKK